MYTGGAFGKLVPYAALAQESIIWMFTEQWPEVPKGGPRQVGKYKLGQ